MNLKALPKMLAMIPSVARGVNLRDLDQIKGIVRAAFPDVQQISGKTLDDWMMSPSRPILLIDVRTPREFAVSHLHSAINARRPAEILNLINERRPSKTVVYCSVGFRSSQIIQGLTGRAAGDIYNLEGSIFEWANGGRSIYQGEIKAGQVHPYGKRWAGLLAPGLASEC